MIFGFFMKHTSFCIKWFATPKKAAAAAAQREKVLHRKRRDERRGCKNRDKKRFRKKSFPKREPAERREPLIFFLFLHFLFLGSKETVGTTTPHTRIFSTKQKKKTKHKRA